MKHLQQSLNVVDDSFTYTVSGDTEPSYLVDSDGYLHDLKASKVIGKYKLGDGQWHLYLNDPNEIESPKMYMSGPPNGLFKLPEFELKSLTALVNQQS